MDKEVVPRRHAVTLAGGVGESQVTVGARHVFKAYGKNTACNDQRDTARHTGRRGTHVLPRGFPS